MNRSEIRTAIEDFVTGLSESSLNRYINWALADLSGRHDFKSLITSTDLEFSEGDAYVELPSDCKKVVEARLINDTSSFVFEIRLKLWVVSRWPNVASDTQGKPVCGYIEDSKVYLYPRPDSDLSLRLTYLKDPEFSDDTTASLVPELDEAVMQLAASQAAQARERYALSDRLRIAAEDSFRNAKERDLGDRVRYDSGGFDPSQVDPTPWLNPFNKG